MEVNGRPAKMKSAKETSRGQANACQGAKKQKDARQVKGKVKGKQKEKGKGK
jgi:hypothetical protein